MSATSVLLSKVFFWDPPGVQATQEVVSQIPLTTKEEFKAAVSAAKQAFPSWRNTPVTTRQRVMLKLQELIRRDMVGFKHIRHLCTSLLPILSKCLFKFDALLDPG